MEKVYVVNGVRIDTYPLIKETQKSFIIEHSGGMNGRYTQPKLRQSVHFHGNYLNMIATKDLQIAKDHAKSNYQKVISRFKSVTDSLDADLNKSNSI